MTKTIVRSNTNVRAIDVKWLKGSTFNFSAHNIGYSDYHAERWRAPSGKWKFMIHAPKGPVPRYYDGREFETVGDMNAAIAEWIRAN
jgi:hypothetical protein